MAIQLSGNPVIDCGYTENIEDIQIENETIENSIVYFYLTCKYQYVIALSIDIHVASSILTDIYTTQFNTNHLPKIYNLLPLQGRYISGEIELGVYNDTYEMFYIQISLVNMQNQIICTNKYTIVYTIGDIPAMMEYLGYILFVELYGGVNNPL